MIEAMLKMTLMPQKQQAAQTLKTGWDIYKPTAKAALRERLRVGELARESTGGLNLQRPQVLTKC
jgi:hypothetical protein